MKKRTKKPEGGASWMDTYGDMVTLLLCFFVLLYSISSVDQVKWENLVRSLNPKAAQQVSQLVMDQNVPEGEQDVPGGSQLIDSSAVEELDEDLEEDTGEGPTDQAALDAQFDQIFENLEQVKEAMGGTADIDIAKGDGYTFITFRDRVFFDGDSSVLRDEGKDLLDKFSAAIAPSAASVKEIQILGHTSQADPNVPNEVVSDRDLSAVRSAVVTAYIQQKNFIDPSKLISSAYGQFHPIAPFDTYENRAKNRRVEMLITKNGDVEKSLNEYYALVYGEQTGEQTNQ